MHASTSAKQTRARLASFAADLVRVERYSGKQLRFEFAIEEFHRKSALYREDDLPTKAVTTWLQYKR